jgi:hypothetical protein
LAASLAFQHDEQPIRVRAEALATVPGAQFYSELASK